MWVKQMITAVFDGHCVICNTTRRVVTALDWFHRVEFLDLHNRAEIDSRFPTLEHDSAMGEIHVFEKSGQMYAGFAATRRMLGAVPLGIPLWAIMYLPGVSNWLGPKLYKFIARNRYAINRMLGVELEQIEREDAACEDGVCKIPQR